MKKNLPKNVKRLIARAGGNAAVTKYLGYGSRNNVYNWQVRGIPPRIKMLLINRIKEIEAAK